MLPLPATNTREPQPVSWYSIYLPRGMEGWVDLCYPAMHQPGVELASYRSQVQRPNHYTTEPHVDDLVREQHVYHVCVSFTFSLGSLGPAASFFVIWSKLRLSTWPFMLAYLASVTTSIIGVMYCQVESLDLSLPASRFAISHTLVTSWLLYLPSPCFFARLLHESSCTILK